MPKITHTLTTITIEIDPDKEYFGQVEQRVRKSGGESLHVWVRVDKK